MHRSKQISISSLHIQAVLSGLMSIDNLISIYIPIASRKICKPAFISLIEDNMKANKLEDLIFNFCVNSNMPTDVENDFIKRALKVHHCTLEMTIKSELMKHFEVFEYVIHQLKSDNFDKSIALLRTSRENTFSSNEARCINKRKIQLFNLGFEGWLRLQYKLATPDQIRMNESSSLTTPLPITQPKLHPFFEDSVKKKNALLNQNQPRHDKHHHYDLQKQRTGRRF